MTSFPSKLDFVSYLQYSPRGMSEMSRVSRDATYAIKQDKHIVAGGETKQAIPFLAERIQSRTTEFAFLLDALGLDRILVPMPRSSPLVTGALWPAKRICEELVAVGLGARVECLLQRTVPTRASKSSSPGERPSPEEHFASLGLVRQQSFMGTSLTLVDDVVTRGSSFVGAVAKLQEAMPTVDLRCFALVRTISHGDVDQVLSPVTGFISYEKEKLRREP